MLCYGMRVGKDITGYRFGLLVARVRVGMTRLGSIWEFQCDCGQAIQRGIASVKFGSIRSCGCLHSAGKDITGQVFGLLTAIRCVGKCKKGNLWEFNCACGNTIQRPTCFVLGNHFRSCGCVRHKHGFAGKGSRSRTYIAWTSMRQRCYDENCSGFFRYGARGIRVCRRWLLSKSGFSNFLSDMGEAPDGLTLERINNSGNYQPDNCCWATRIQQAQNRRSTVNFTFEGEKVCLTELARRTGMTRKTIQRRIKAGLSVMEAVRSNSYLLSKGVRIRRRDIT